VILQLSNCICLTQCSWNKEKGVRVLQEAYAANIQMFTFVPLPTTCPSYDELVYTIQLTFSVFFTYWLIIIIIVTGVAMWYENDSYRYRTIADGTRSIILSISVVLTILLIVCGLLLIYKRLYRSPQNTRNSYLGSKDMSSKKSVIAAIRRQANSQQVEVPSSYPWYLQKQ